jgi:hypothetical protein
MKKTILWLVIQALLLTVTIAHADPIQDNTLNNFKTGWFPNYYKQKGPLTCPQTCKIQANGTAEQEKVMMGSINKTHVCKVGDRKRTRYPVRGEHFIYGNQFDANPACYVSDMRGRVGESERFYCLCITNAQSTCRNPDLVVTKINKPQWDNPNNRSIITAVIENIGLTAAGQSIARVIDPSTTQATGAPQNAIANTPVLAAGASTTVTFYLPYWVYNPDAELEVTADYKGMIKECNENNNTAVFNDRG